ncbi:MAG: hypothetical protein JWR08_2083 [Enterovirga sp.]|jgi:hypothetical protein|nr:hypothetical protein [Enterovirga sp.]
MERRNDLPPAQTIRPVDPPPDSRAPTTAQLKADIDSGRTGDKVGVFDPGLSPLGTDDEAAGTPAEPHRIRLARRLETAQRWAQGAGRAAFAHRQVDTALAAYIAGILIIAAVLAAGIGWVRP